MTAPDGRESPSKDVCPLIWNQPPIKIAESLLRRTPTRPCSNAMPLSYSKSVDFMAFVS